MVSDFMSERPEEGSESEEEEQEGEGGFAGSMDDLYEEEPAPEVAAPRHVQASALFAFQIIKD